MPYNLYLNVLSNLSQAAAAVPTFLLPLLLMLPVWRASKWAVPVPVLGLFLPLVPDRRQRELCFVFA